MESTMTSGLMLDASETSLLLAYVAELEDKIDLLTDVLEKEP